MGIPQARAIIVLVAVAFTFSIFIPMTHAANTVTVQVSMLDGVDYTRFNCPLLVSGIWHYVNLTFDQAPDDFTLRLFKGDSAPATQNNTNYYAWEYDDTSPGKFIDLNGNGSVFLNKNSTKKGTVYSFVVGVADMLPNIVDYCENWTLEVSAAGSQLYTHRVVLEKLSTGISMSKPTSISFSVEPFTPMDAQGNTFFKIGNKGNIPVFVTLDSSKYNNIIEISNFNKNISVGDVSTNYVTIHARSWPPQILELKNVTGVGSYPRSLFVDTQATVTLYTSFDIDIPTLVINIGHSNYTIDELPGTNITFQHLAQLHMNEGEQKDINAYVSGNGDVELEVSADGHNVRLVKLFDNHVEKPSPLSFLSTNTTERTVTVRVEALSEGTTGTITYKLTSGGATQTYTTKIIIGPPTTVKPTAALNLDFIGKLAVIILVLAVVFYMSFAYIRHKRR